MNRTFARAFVPVVSSALQAATQAADVAFNNAKSHKITSVLNLSVLCLKYPENSWHCAKFSEAAKI